MSNWKQSDVPSDWKYGDPIRVTRTDNSTDWITTGDTDYNSLAQEIAQGGIAGRSTSSVSNTGSADGIETALAMLFVTLVIGVITLPFTSIVNGRRAWRGGQRFLAFRHFSVVILFYVIPLLGYAGNVWVNAANTRIVNKHRSTMMCQKVAAWASVEDGTLYFQTDSAKRAGISLNGQSPMEFPIGSAGAEGISKFALNVNMDQVVLVYVRRVGGDADSTTETCNRVLVQDGIAVTSDTYTTTMVSDSDTYTTLERIVVITYAWKNSMPEKW
ncbi:MAG: hypothetical protein H6667_04735 [Ardenticatenaceae bacterium]|nr:hypothetical protein [Ardenticatenaceae bacterium]